MLITVLAGEARPRFQCILQCLLSVRVHDSNNPKLFEMFLIISKFQTATRNEVLDPY